ncbi:MAG: holin family protein [Gammaproteobacteria bacterium]|nr:holin family protein [Gammaproteobacteria bacterium]MDH5802253.1 holin family protein [Gammaproteobacteria bacterium]
MDWSAVGKTVAGFAPLLGSALGPAGTALGGLIASAFGVDNNPDAIQKAIQADPQAALKLREIESNNATELQRIVLANESKQLETVNATMRAEAASADKFTRRWRPTFGYVMAFTWTMQTLLIVVGVLYAIIARPENSGDIITALGTMIGALSTQWAVGLSVVGVTAYKRSHDKQVLAGQKPESALGQILGSFRK